MKTNLNETEQKVLDLCIENAKSYNEEGAFCYEEIDYKALGLTLNQLKGYLSQLCQKGYIQVLEDCYFSHLVNDFKQ